MVCALATATNTVLNIIDVDKTARKVHLTKIKPEPDQNQQMQSEIYLHRKNNYYSAMGAHKENHISSEWLKGGLRRQISVNTYVNQIPIKTNKRSDHIVIKHINAQSLIPKWDVIKLLIENEELDILCISETWLQPNILDDLISIKNYNVFRNGNPLNSRGSGACIYVKNIFTCKKYENIEITHGEPSKGIEPVCMGKHTSK